MDTDLIKIRQFVLLLAAAFSLAGISFQLMRLISSLRDNVNDLRKTVQNIGLLSDGLVEDHKSLREAISSFKKAGEGLKETVSNFNTKISKPLGAISALLGTVGAFAQGINKRFGKKE